MTTYERVYGCTLFFFACVGILVTIFHVLLPICMATLRGWAYVVFNLICANKGWWKRWTAWKVLPGFIFRYYWRGFFMEGSVDRVDCGYWTFIPPFRIKRSRRYHQ